VALTIALEQGEAAAGSVVRGTVTGLDGEPDARGLIVSLIHDTKHLSRQKPVEVAYDLAEGRPASLPFDLTLPSDALPSFAGRRYASSWRVEARVDLPRRQDVTASEPLVVLAGAEGRPPEGEPMTAGSPGPGRFRLFAGVFLVADLVALAGIYAAFGSLPGVVALAFVIPAMITLAALAWLGLRPAPVERFVVSAPRARWRFGEEVPVRIRVEGDPERVGEIVVALRGEEVWMVSTGKTAHEQRASFHEEEQRLAGTELASARSGGRRWDHELRFRLPDAGPPSHGREIQWSVQARVRVAQRIDPAVSLRLEVAGTVPADERS
jgi:hypothetical protein